MGRLVPDGLVSQTDALSLTPTDQVRSLIRAAGYLHSKSLELGVTSSFPSFSLNPKVLPSVRPPRSTQ